MNKRWKPNIIKQRSVTKFMISLSKLIENEEFGCCKKLLKKLNFKNLGISRALAMLSMFKDIKEIQKEWSHYLNRLVLWIHNKYPDRASCLLEGYVSKE